MAGVFAPFIPIQIVTQPSAGRTDPGEKQERKPEVIAVPVEEGAFGAVDDSCRSPMHRELGGFFGGRFCDVCSTRNLTGHRLTYGGYLDVNGRSTRFRRILWLSG